MTDTAALSRALDVVESLVEHDAAEADARARAQDADREAIEASPLGRVALLLGAKLTELDHLEMTADGDVVVHFVPRLQAGGTDRVTSPPLIIVSPANPDGAGRHGVLATIASRDPSSRRMPAFTPRLPATADEDVAFDADQATTEGDQEAEVPPAETTAESGDRESGGGRRRRRRERRSDDAAAAQPSWAPAGKPTNPHREAAREARSELARIDRRRSEIGEALRPAAGTTPGQQVVLRRELDELDLARDAAAGPIVQLDRLATDFDFALRAWRSAEVDEALGTIVLDAGALLGQVVDLVDRLRAVVDAAGGPMDLNLEVPVPRQLYGLADYYTAERRADLAAAVETARSRAAAAQARCR